MQANGRRDPIFRAIEAMTALAEIFERRREVLARDAGITIEQWRVLEEISTRHFIPSMFAKSRDSSAAAVSKILRQLLDTGLVSAAIGSADRRNRHYKLTAKGIRTLGDLAQRARERDRGDLDGILARRTGRVQQVRRDLVRSNRALFARKNHAPRGGIVIHRIFY